MTKRNLKVEIAGTTKSFFDGSLDLETLAAEQGGVSVASNFEALLGDFWPEDETSDDFIAALRKWRHEGHVVERS